MTILPSYLTLPTEELVRASPVRLEIVEDLPTLFLHMARAIADEIQANNRAGSITRLVLPVGPVDQYPILARICNEERISWRRVFTFNMEEYCDWQGRAVPPDHPLGFRRSMQDMLFDR